VDMGLMVWDWMVTVLFHFWIVWDRTVPAGQLFDLEMQSSGTDGQSRETEKGVYDDHTSRHSLRVMSYAACGVCLFGFFFWQDTRSILAAGAEYGHVTPFYILHDLGTGRETGDAFVSLY
jgi:hypothetical protein